MDLAIRAEKRATLGKIIDAIGYLVVNPDAQLRRMLAVDANGKEVLPTDPAACRWCALGRVLHDLNTPTPVIGFIAESPEHELAIQLSDLYSVATKVMAPLGLDRHMFVQANDSPKGMMTRSGSLAMLRDKLIDHRDRMFRGEEA